VSELTLPALKAAILASAGAVYGRDSRYFDTGRSVLTKRLRRREYSKLPKALALLGYTLLRDIFDRRGKKSAFTKE
ncbi:MAG: hypothetical protein LBC78_00900, partial [Oscillospiraceae bacterium]|nr:hypothetical protein [Oscillospiraceae bacterium]